MHNKLDLVSNTRQVVLICKLVPFLCLFYLFPFTGDELSHTHSPENSKRELHSTLMYREDGLPADIDRRLGVDHKIINRYTTKNATVYAQIYAMV